MAESLAAGATVHRPATTFADGLSITRPVAGALEQVATAVDEILPVADDAMLAAIRLLLEKAGVLAEPSGAAGVAALMEHQPRFRGATVVSVITGTNVDPRLLSHLTDR